MSNAISRWRHEVASNRKLLKCLMHLVTYEQCKTNDVTARKHVPRCLVRCNFFSHNIQFSTRMANFRQKLNLTFAEALTQTKTKNAFEFIISIKGRGIKGNQRKDIHMVHIIALPIRQLESTNSSS